MLSDVCFTLRKWTLFTTSVLILLTSSVLVWIIPFRYHFTISLVIFAIVSLFGIFGSARESLILTRSFAVFWAIISIGGIICTFVVHIVFLALAFVGILLTLLATSFIRSIHARDMRLILEDINNQRTFVQIVTTSNTDPFIQQQNATASLYDCDNQLPKYASITRPPPPPYSSINNYQKF